MPKQIKKKELPKGERTNSLLGIFTMIAAFALGGTLMALISVLEKGGTAGTALGIAVFGCLVLFLAIALWHCIQGIVTYEKHEHYGVLLTSVLSGVSVLGCLLNIQMALSLLFTSLGMEDAAKNVIGGRSFAEFISGQRMAWIIMIVGVATGVFTGLIGMGKLGPSYAGGRVRGNNSRRR